MKQPPEQNAAEANAAVSGFRDRVRAIVLHKWFDRTVLTVIFVNCAFLATSDPKDQDPESDANKMLSVADTVFQILYTIEMVLKLLGLRVWKPYDAYFRDGWNVLDFFLVMGGWVTYLPQVGESGLSSVRVVRVLRPLRAINSVEGLRILIDSMLASIPQLCNVMGLCAFIFFVFGIIGMQLFSGKMGQRCHWPAGYGDGEVSDAGLIPAEDTGLLCTNSSEVGRQCPEIDGIQTICLDSGESPNYGITNFDNIATAFLAIFQMITLEGWVDVMYWIEELMTSWTNLYFLLLITIGSLFLLNLVVAVITLNLSNERQAKQKISQAKRWAAVASLGATGEDTAAADVMWAAVAQTYQQEADELEAKAADSPPARTMSMEDSSEFYQHPSMMSQRTKQRSIRRVATGDSRNPGSLSHMLEGRKRQKVAPETSVVEREPSKGVDAAGGTGGDAVRAQPSPSRSTAELLENKPVPRRPVLAPLATRPSAASGGGNEEILSGHGWGSSPDLGAGQPAQDGEEPDPKGALAAAAAAESRDEVPGAEPDDGSVPTSLAMIEATLDRSKAAVRDGDVRRAMESLSHAWKGLAQLPGAPSPRSRRAMIKLPVQRMSSYAEEAEAAFEAHATEDVDSEGDWDNSHAMDRFRPPPSASQWRHFCFKVAQSPYFTATVMVLIIINTMMLASEHHDMPLWLVDLLSNGNLALTIAFAAEMVLKVSGYSLEGYVSDGFNVFDGSIVMISLLELATAGGGGSGVSALRSFRLLRVFKLARSWTSLNELLTTTMNTLPRLGPFTVVLLLFMFIYSLLGMQLFGGKLGVGDEVPRSNYDDLLWSFTTTFQVLSGENWNEVMYDTVRFTGWGAALYFISLICVGSYVVLNMFLGILIDNFCNDDDDEEEAREIEAEEKLAAQVAEAEAELMRESEANKLRESATSPLAASSPSAGDGTPGGGLSDSRQELASSTQKKMLELRKQHIRAVQEKKALSIAHEKQMNYLKDEEKRRRMFKSHPSYSHRAFFLLKGTNPVRNAVGNLTMHGMFDAFILLLIGFSCVLLAVDSSTPAEGSARDTITLLDKIVTILFIVEMALKLLAFGVFAHPGAYVRDPWNLLDGSIVVLSLVDMAIGSENLRILKIIRFCRALRPLRMIRRLEGLRIVVNAVLKAIPNCVHVMMVSLLFFLIFAILGVNFFGGRFYSCTDESRSCYSKFAEEGTCPPELDCVGSYLNPDTGLLEPREWVNPSYGVPSVVHPSYHFDNVAAGILTLFEVASLELWLDVMNRAADVTTLGHEPVRDANRYAVFFFMAFVVVASYFILNLFVTIVVDNFGKMKAKVEHGGTVFMTATQRQWVDMQRVVARQKPNPLHVPAMGAHPVRARCFQLVTTPRFELFIMAAIAANILMMALTFVGQPEEWGTFLLVMNYFFGALFIVEAILKNIGLGPSQYIASNWNKFDLTVVLLTIMDWVLSATGETVSIDFTTLRIVRVARIFRLVKTSKRLRTIFTTLMLSLPALGNVGTLLMMLFFMYAIAGQSLFAEVPHGDFINEHANFEDFWRSFLLLFRMSTGESWNGVMHDCAQGAEVWIVVVYFTSFVLVGQFVMLNLFVAVILENFENEMEAENDVNSVKPADMELFAIEWAKIHARLKREAEEKAGHPVKLRLDWLPADELVTLLFELPPPLGIDNFLRDSNAFMMRTIRVLDVPLNAEMEIHYQMTLRALVRRVVGENLPSDVDQSHFPPRNLGDVAAELTEFSTSHLFAARLMARWCRRMMDRRDKGKAGNGGAGGPTAPPREATATPAQQDEKAAPVTAKAATQAVAPLPSVPARSSPPAPPR